MAFSTIILTIVAWKVAMLQACEASNGLFDDGIAVRDQSGKESFKPAKQAMAFSTVKCAGKAFGIEAFQTC